MKKNIIFISILVIVVILYIILNRSNNLSINNNIEEIIKESTLDFATRVTRKASYLGIPEGKEGSSQRAKLIENIFAENARLRPTVGQLIRTKYSRPNIFQYFNQYFSASNIPELSVLKVQHNVVKISNKLYANYAFVKFQLPENETVLALMSFIWQKQRDGQWKILLLHSSPIQDVPDVFLNYKYSDKFKFN